MLIWFLIIIILIAVVFAVTIYLYDSSHFKNLTNYSYFQVIMKTNIRTTYNLFQTLQSVHKKSRVLINVKLPNVNEIIDAIYIHPSGVYVIDLKNMNGWIYGNDKASEWIIAMYKEKTYKFQNPVIQNKIMVNEVQNTLSINKPNLFHSLIIFSNNTVFKKLSVKEKNVTVINIRDIKSFLKKKTNHQLSVVEIEELYKSLESYMTVSTINQNEI